MTETMTMNIKGIPVETNERLCRLAEERGMSRNEFVKQLLIASAESPLEVGRIEREEKMFSLIADVLTEVIETNQEVRKQLSRF